MSMRFRGGLLTAFVALVLTTQTVLQCVIAEEARPQRLDDAPVKHLAEIQLHSVEEIESLFSRAESLVSSDTRYGEHPPVAFVLHGPEIAYFARQNLPQYRMLVERAAQLDAFGVVDIKVCETYLRILNIPATELPPFIETVPFGPAEEDRLRGAGYTRF